MRTVLRPAARKKTKPKSGNFFAFVEDKIPAPLPDLSQDVKAWQTIQTILHPQPTHVDIEEDFLCPIGQQLIRDPVTTVDGQLYEREAIALWLQDHDDSPLTNLPLSSKQLTPIPIIKRQISQFVKTNPPLEDSAEWYLPHGWVVELQAACQAGDEKTIKELASRDRRLLVHTFRKQLFAGQTALHLAAAGHPQALDILIELLERRQTGLALAALLQADPQGRLPIHCTAEARQDARTLLKLTARMGGQLKAVQPLPDGWPAGFDDRSLNEALVECVAHERLEEIRCFLRLGASPQANTGNKETRVYQAVKQGRFRSLSTLLEAKADPNLSAQRLNDSPLHAAIRQKDSRMVAALREAGADLDRSLINGQTPLHLAAESSSTDLLQALVGEVKRLPTALLEKTDTQGETPLHRAAAAGLTDNLTWLLDHGAQLQVINVKGQTALHLAAHANHTEMISLLLKRGALLSQTDSEGNTTLHTAAEAGATEVVMLLLKAGIAANLKNKAGKTARQLAENNDHEETVQQHDQTVTELQVAEEKELKGQGFLGIFMLKQQQIIQDQQKQLEEYRLEIKAQQQKIQDLEQNFKKQISDLKNKELKKQDGQIRDLETDFKKQVSDLKDQEIKPLLKWKADLFTQPLERKLIALRQQEELRLKLVTACEQGDIKVVRQALEEGAKPFYPDLEAKQKQPFGAAVWGMRPDVVNTLLKQAGGVAPMTWDECEEHNLKHYKEVFIVPKFDPQTFGEWDALLQKMDPNPFVRAFHLKKADEQWHDKCTVRWEALRLWIGVLAWAVCFDDEDRALREWKSCHAGVCDATEAGYVGFRTQIKQGVESASRPKILLGSSSNSSTTSLLSTQVMLPTENKPHLSEIKLSSVTEKTTTAISNPPPALPPASQSTQILIPAPKPTASTEQLKLQDQLITACKQGDEKMVTALLKQGAKPDMSDAKGEQPLGAAVWGMCPDVVNALLKEAKGIAPMTWEECEKHNLKYYKEIFIIPKFAPQTFGEWHTLLQKMDPTFVRAFHLKKADEIYKSSWEGNLEEEDIRRESERRIRNCTEAGYVSFRTQIKQGVESASRPTTGKNF